MKRLRLLITEIKSLILTKFGITQEKWPTLHGTLSIDAVFIFIIVLWCIQFFFDPLTYIKQKFNTSGTDNNQYAAIIKSYQSKDCDFVPNEWLAGQGLIKINDNTLTLSTSSPNATLRLKKQIPLNSEIRIKLTSYSENQIGFILSMHNLYEIVIGDGDFRGVTLGIQKNNKKTLLRDVNGRTWNFLPKKVGQGDEIYLIIKQEISKLEDDYYQINLNLSTMSNVDGSKSTLYTTYNVPLSADLKYDQIEPYISIGLQKPHDNSFESIKIHCFDITTNN